MSFKPPSAIKDYSLIYSGDPALNRAACQL